jgi:hypothetical protein
VDAYIAVVGEFSLICAVHNIKKMVKAMMAVLVRPKFGRSSLQWI